MHSCCFFWLGPGVISRGAGPGSSNLVEVWIWFADIFMFMFRFRFIYLVILVLSVRAFKVNVETWNTPNDGSWSLEHWQCPGTRQWRMALRGRSCLLPGRPMIDGPPPRCIPLRMRRRSGMQWPCGSEVWSCWPISPVCPARPQGPHRCRVAQISFV